MYLGERVENLEEENFQQVRKNVGPVPEPDFESVRSEGVGAWVQL